MKRIKLPLVVLIFSVVFSSCKNDDETDVNPVNIPKEFSELSDEENKKNLEDNAIALVNEMNALKSTSGIKASIAFAHFLELSSPLNNESEFGRTTKTSSYALIKALSAYGQSNANAKKVFTAMRSTERDPETAQEVFDELAGTYTWDKTSEGWKESKGGNKVIFEFPSTENGTNNNAVFTIHSYAGTKTPSNPFDDEYTGDLPTGLAAELKVDGSVVMEYGFKAAYNANGEPTSFETSLALVPFKFTVTLTNNTKEASVNYSLTNNTETLIDMGVGVKGDLTSGGIENADGEDFLHSGFAFFQVLNIKLAGDVNIKALIQDIDKIYDDEGDDDFNDDAATDKVVDSYNKHINLTLFYVEENVKIADTEFYVTEKTEEYCWDYYDYEMGEWTWECDQDTYKSENIRLVFSDGSKMDLDTYTEGSFTDLHDELEKLLDDIEADLN